MACPIENQVASIQRRTIHYPSLAQLRRILKAARGHIYSHAILIIPGHLERMQERNPQPQPVNSQQETAGAGFGLARFGGDLEVA